MFASNAEIVVFLAEYSEDCSELEILLRYDKSVIILSWKTFIIGVDYDVEGRRNSQQKVTEFNQNSPPERFRLEFSVKNNLSLLDVSFRFLNQV